MIVVKPGSKVIPQPKPEQDEKSFTPYAEHFIAYGENTDKGNDPQL